MLKKASTAAVNLPGAFALPSQQAQGEMVAGKIAKAYWLVSSCTCEDGCSLLRI